MNQVRIFEENFAELYKDGVKFLQITTTDINESTVELEKWVPSSNSGLLCSYCKTSFNDVQQQREHYKLDWHRYNLKQNLLSRPPLTEEEFNEKADDVSSISGSDSEKEDNLENVATSQGKIFLKNSQGIVFSLFRCLLFNKKDELDDVILRQRLRECHSNKQWTILMLGGGHFAGAVFQGSTAILHKTFHCYTVRAGQGGSQSSKDNRSGSQLKSAGASLRRYNETALIQHVRNIMETWREEIAKSNMIIYRATGSYNQSVLFGGKDPLLNRSDIRLKTIPFSTRRATFTELKRVHTVLSSASVYESFENVTDILKHDINESTPKRTKNKANIVNRSKSRESVERPLPVICSSDSSSEEINNAAQNDLDTELYVCEQEISLQNALKNFDDSLSFEERKRLRKKPKKHKPKIKREIEREMLRKKNLYELVSQGNIKEFEIYLKPDNFEKESENSIKNSLMNEAIDNQGNTVLHVAAVHQQFDMVRYLLEQDFEPCVKNKKRQTPYSCTQDKDMRTVFKNFAQDFPEKYNYNKAQIPIPVLLTEEQLEKKKQLKKLKKEKEKEKKKENSMKKQDESDRERFLRLSDREKRALAAERRILSQSGTVIARCFLCATDISGKVPFEYSGNRFCTIDCLKAHRLSQTKHIN